MAPDLVALGDTLEAAAERDLRRRRTRRQAFMNGLASLAIAVPVALSLLSADVPRLTPSSAVSNPIPPVRTLPLGARTVIAWTPGDRLAVGHIPDERLLPAQPVKQCLGGGDCRVPIPYTLDAPLGKV
jgi:hypothetical protein